MVIGARLYKVDYRGRQDIYRYCRGQEIVCVSMLRRCVLVFLWSGGGEGLWGGRGRAEEKHTRTPVGFISWEERKS